MNIVFYVLKFGQLKNLANNLKSWPGGPADNQANNPYLCPVIYQIIVNDIFFSQTHDLF